VRVAVRTAVRYAVAGAHHGCNGRGGGSRCDESPEFVALECVSSLCLRQTPGLGFEVPESPSCVLLLSGLRTLLLSCLIRHGDFSFLLFESYC
jgi:hypothetical protein